MHNCHILQCPTACICKLHQYKTHFSTSHIMPKLAEFSSNQQYSVKNLTLPSAIEFDPLICSNNISLIFTVNQLFNFHAFWVTQWIIWSWYNGSWWMWWVVECGTMGEASVRCVLYTCSACTYLPLNGLYCFTHPHCHGKTLKKLTVSGLFWLQSPDHQTSKPLSLIHIWRCRRSTLCRSRWSPYH